MTLLLPQVGPLPKAGALRMTLMRMREQGFDIRRLVAAALQAGALEGQEALEVARIPGLDPWAIAAAPGNAAGAAIDDVNGIGAAPAAAAPEDGVRVSVAQQGRLVWAQSGSYKFWWPGEALDPWDLPQGRSLTADQIRSLPRSEWKR